MLIHCVFPVIFASKTTSEKIRRTPQNHIFKSPAPLKRTAFLTTSTQNKHCNIMESITYSGIKAQSKKQVMSSLWKNRSMMIFSIFYKQFIPSISDIIWLTEAVSEAFYRFLFSSAVYTISLHNLSSSSFIIWALLFIKTNQSHDIRELLLSTIRQNLKHSFLCWTVSETSLSCALFVYVLLYDDNMCIYPCI